MDTIKVYGSIPVKMLADGQVHRAQRYLIGEIPAIEGWMLNVGRVRITHASLSEGRSHSLTDGPSSAASYDVGNLQVLGEIVEEGGLHSVGKQIFLHLNELMATPPSEAPRLAIDVERLRQSEFGQRIARIVAQGDETGARVAQARHLGAPWLKGRGLSLDRRTGTLAVEPSASLIQMARLFRIPGTSVEMYDMRPFITRGSFQMPGTIFRLEDFELEQLRAEPGFRAYEDLGQRIDEIYALSETYKRVRDLRDVGLPGNTQDRESDLRDAAPCAARWGLDVERFVLPESTYEALRDAHGRAVPRPRVR